MLGRDGLVIGAALSRGPDENACNVKSGSVDICLAVETAAAASTPPVAPLVHRDGDHCSVAALAQVVADGA